MLQRSLLDYAVCNAKKTFARVAATTTATATTVTAASSLEKTASEGSRHVAVECLTCPTGSQDAPIEVEDSNSMPAQISEKTAACHQRKSKPEELDAPSHDLLDPCNAPKRVKIGLNSSASTSLAAAELTEPSLSSSSRWLAALMTDTDWRKFLQPVMSDSWRGGAFLNIEAFLDAEAAAGRLILPSRPMIFSAFNSTAFSRLKVVLIGQDPYHNLNQAHGLCFSVLPGVALPPSLRNVYKELERDIPDFQSPQHGYLQSWAEQGMLMLNATLTVEAHKANSHSAKSGWEVFTDAVIQQISNQHPNRLVFLLWGRFAQKKKKLINTRRHMVIENAHPSPLSAHQGWHGCSCFSSCNKALKELNHDPMDWKLPLNPQA